MLRRYVLNWILEEPEIPGNEALALRLVGDGAAGVPAPRLLASDPDGTELGVPLTLMTALPGEPVWHPADRTGWLRALAELVVQIHAHTGVHRAGRLVPIRPVLPHPTAVEPAPEGLVDRVRAMGRPVPGK